MKKFLFSFAFVCVSIMSFVPFGALAMEDPIAECSLCAGDFAEKPKFECSSCHAVCCMGCLKNHYSHRKAVVEKEAMAEGHMIREKIIVDQPCNRCPFCRAQLDEVICARLDADLDVEIARLENELAVLRECYAEGEIPEAIINRMISLDDQIEAMRRHKQEGERQGVRRARAEGAPEEDEHESRARRLREDLNAASLLQQIEQNLEVVPMLLSAGTRVAHDTLVEMHVHLALMFHQLEEFAHELSHDDAGRLVELRELFERMPAR